MTTDRFAALRAILADTSRGSLFVTVHEDTLRALLDTAAMYKLADGTRQVWIERAERAEAERDTAHATIASPC